MISIFSVVFVLTFIISVMIFGWQSVKDSVIGNSTKKLLKQDWTISTYGAFPITITSPDVLKRLEGTESQNLNGALLVIQFIFITDKT